MYNFGPYSSTLWIKRIEHRKWNRGRNGLHQLASFGKIGRKSRNHLQANAIKSNPEQLLKPLSHQRRLSSDTPCLGRLPRVEHLRGHSLLHRGDCARPLLQLLDPLLVRLEAEGPRRPVTCLDECYFYREGSGFRTNYTDMLGATV